MCACVGLLVKVCLDRLSHTWSHICALHNTRDNPPAFLQDFLPVVVGPSPLFRERFGVCLASCSPLSVGRVGLHDDTAVPLLTQWLGVATRPVRLGGGWAAPSVYPLGSEGGRLPPFGSPRGAGGESPCRGILYPLSPLYVFVYLYMYTSCIPRPRPAQAVAFPRCFRALPRAGRPRVARLALSRRFRWPPAALPRGPRPPCVALPRGAIAHCDTAGTPVGVWEPPPHANEESVIII